MKSYLERKVFKFIVIAFLLNSCGPGQNKVVPVSPDRPSRISISGVNIQIPAGAVDERVLITAKTLNRPSPEMKKSVKLCSRIFELSGYEGKTFNTPITITLSYRRSSRDESRVYPAYWDGRQWIEVDGEIHGSTIVVETDHLSYWAVIKEYYGNIVKEKRKKYLDNYNKNIFVTGKSVYIEENFNIPIDYSTSFTSNLRQLEKRTKTKRDREKYMQFKKNNWIYNEYGSPPNEVNFTFISEGIKTGNNSEKLYFSAIPDHFDNREYAENAYSLQKGIGKVKNSHILPFSKTDKDSYLFLIVPKTGITINESDITGSYFFPEEGWKEFDFWDYGVIDKLTWALAQKKYPLDKLAKIGKFFRKLQIDNRVSNIAYNELEYDLYIIPFSGFWLDTGFEGKIFSQISQIKKAHLATAIRFKIPITYNLPGEYKIGVLFNPGCTINGYTTGGLSDMYFHIGDGILNDQIYEIDLISDYEIPYFDNIKRDLNNYSILQNQERWDESFDYIYPKVFQYIPRDAFVNLFEQFNNQGFDFKCGDFKLNKIEHFVNYHGEIFTLVENRIRCKFSIPLKFNKSISSITDEYYELFGPGNVRFDNKTNTFYIILTNPIFAISANNGKSWKFCDANIVTQASGVIPDHVLNELGLY